jgi:mono/diheme cytochrome c family protein
MRPSLRAMLVACLAMIPAVMIPVLAHANDQALTLAFGSTKQSFAAADLMARPDAVDLTIDKDPAYKRAMTYRAVPLLALLANAIDSGADTIEARSTDGFVSQLPMSVIAAGRTGGSVPWIAIEDPAAPWPKLPGKSQSAGPFFLIWQNPERSNVGPEQWPYALVELTGVESPAHRWPQMAVTATGDDTASARRGLAVFVKHCLACHKIDGAGEGTMGPDLAKPMSPTAYLTPASLRQLIRNPKSVRTWPDQKMSGFNEKALPDADLDDLVAYLAYIARAN